MLNRRKMFSWLGAAAAAPVVVSKVNIEALAASPEPFVTGAVEEWATYDLDVSCCHSFDEIVATTLRRRAPMFDGLTENNAFINRLKKRA